MTTGFVQGDGGYIAMNQEGLIDLGEFDLSNYAPGWNPNMVTSANELGQYFTDPRLPSVGAVAPVDALGNLGAGFQTALAMQQPIPDPGPSYEAARAQRMQALMEDLGLLDKTASAASAQIAAQRARPMNFGGLSIGAEASQLFNRAYDFAEGAVGQGRLTAEARLRQQANQALDEILSGNYRAGYQGQVQQALDLPNQALAAAGQLNEVGMSNQKTDLQLLLEEAANRRAEMAASQQQQLARFGEAGTDARFRADQAGTDARFRTGLANSNAQLGVTEMGQNQRQYWNAYYTDLLEKNKWFRELPFQTQKLIVDGQIATQGNLTSLEVARIGANTSTSNNAADIAARASEGALDRAAQAQEAEANRQASIAAEGRRNAAQESLVRLQAQLNSAKTPEEQNLLKLQIQEAQLKVDQAQQELDYYKANPGPKLTAAQIKTAETDGRERAAIAPALQNWVPGDTSSETNFFMNLAAAYARGGSQTEIQNQLFNYFVGKIPKGAKGEEYKRQYALAQSQAASAWSQVRQWSGSGLSASARADLLQEFENRIKAREESLRQATNTKVGKF